jgi:hypothetical protein
MSNPSAPRIISCALAVGLLFAVALGVSASTSGVASSSDGREAGQPRVAPGVQTVFSPTFALVGLMLGTPIGAAIGFLWGRSGLSGALGLILVTLVGGLVGLMAAGLLGAETRVAVIDTSASMEHGAPLGVLIGGGVLGVIGGAACAWLFRPSKRFEGASAH